MDRLLVVADLRGLDHLATPRATRRLLVLHPGAAATPEDLVEFARERLGRHEYPREVRVVPAVPLTPVGKVDRKRLRAMV